jgi:hypothetical protein
MVLRGRAVHLPELTTTLLIFLSSDVGTNGKQRWDLNMVERQIFDQPSSVSAADGNVIVAGPGSVHLALTPDAAEQTSDLLWIGAMQARAQHRNEIEHVDSDNGVEDTDID